MNDRAAYSPARPTTAAPSQTPPKDAMMAEAPAKTETPVPAKPQEPVLSSMWSALSLAWELGYLIAIPAVVFGIGGSWLDRMLHTTPLFILLGFFIAVAASGFFIRRRVREIINPK